VDLVVIARGEAAAASYDELLASLGRLLGRARLLPGERAQ
jgi:RNase P protein component